MSDLRFRSRAASLMLALSFLVQVSAFANSDDESDDDIASDHRGSISHTNPHNEKAPLMGNRNTNYSSINNSGNNSVEMQAVRLTTTAPKKADALVSGKAQAQTSCWTKFTKAVASPFRWVASKARS